MRCAKKSLPLIAIMLLMSMVIPSSVLAHGGKTDSNGGHTDSSTGEYHYHHGYPAHQHYDIDGDGRKDCPYDFDDKTDHSSNDSSSSGSSGGSNGTGTSSSDKNNPSSSVNPSKPQTNKTQSNSHKDKTPTANYIWAGISILSFLILLLTFCFDSKFGDWWIPKSEKGEGLFFFLLFLLFITAIPVIIIALLGYAFLFLPVRGICSAIMKRLKQNKQFALTQEIQSTKPYCTSSHAETVTKPQQTQIVSMQDTLTPNLSKSAKTCRYLWMQVFDFRRENLIQPNFKRDIAYWTALFFVVTKIIRKQNLVDEIYEHFPNVTAFAIENKYFPYDADASSKKGTEIYRGYAISLNKSNIDPRTEEGIASMWPWVCYHFPPYYSSRKRLSFEDVVRRTIEYTCKLYEIQNPLKTSSTEVTNVKYSISDDENSFLP